MNWCQCEAGWNQIHICQRQSVAIWPGRKIEQSGGFEFPELAQIHLSNSGNNSFGVVVLIGRDQMQRLIAEPGVERFENLYAQKGLPAKIFIYCPSENCQGLVTIS